MSNSLHAPFEIDKKQVKAAFNRSATNYDKVAVLQREVSHRMAERLDFILQQPSNIVDLGSGTGFGLRGLEKRFPKAHIIALDIAFNMLQETRKQQTWLQRWRKKSTWLCADAEQIPLATQSQNLIFSNLTLQWCQDLEASFNDIHRCLKPGGLFMFSSFGPDTLKELRHAWKQADDYNHVNAFIDMHDVGDALMRSGFSDPVMDVEHLTLTYSDVMQLMRELKTLGAHNVTAGRAKGLTGRGQLNTMIDAYEQLRTNGKLPCTYEVVYGHAWKAEGDTQRTKETSGITKISIESIKRSNK